MLKSTGQPMQQRVPHLSSDKSDYFQKIFLTEKLPMPVVVNGFKSSYFRGNDNFQTIRRLGGGKGYILNMKTCYLLIYYRGDKVFEDLSK